MEDRFRKLIKNNDIELIQDGSYLRSYRAMINFFADKENINTDDVVVAIHMVYGWMPTIVTVHKDVSLHETAQILNEIRKNKIVTDDQLKQLKALINNSLVGTSKLLHFLVPDTFPIWDSNLYKFVFQSHPYGYRVNKISNYRKYQKIVIDMIGTLEIDSFHTSVQKKVGYPISKVRAVEVAMYLKGQTS